MQRSAPPGTPPVAPRRAGLRALTAAARARTRAVVTTAVLAAAVLTTACGSPGAPPRDTEDPPRDGPSNPRISADDRFEAGDWDGAAEGYRRELADRPGDPALVEKLATARRLAANAHAEAAVRKARENDPVGAGIELERAEAFDRESPVVKRARTALGDRVSAGRKATELRETGRMLVETDPDRAVEVLSEARRLAPYDDDIVALLRDATLHSEARRAVARAEEAWVAGDRRRAVGHLRTATVGDRPIAAAALLRARIESDLLADAAGDDVETARAAWKIAEDASLSPSATAHLRSRFTDLLASRARRLESQGRPAAAALLEIEAARTGARVATPNADRVRAAAAPRVHVLPFDDGTGGSVDGARLAAALRDRIAVDAAGSSAALFADTSPPPAGAGWPDVVVEGRVLSSRAVEGRTATEIRNVRHVVGTREADNPEAAALAAETDRTRAALDAAEESLRSAETRLRKILELPFIQNPGGRVIREGDATYQTQRANAEAAVEDARRRRDRVKQEEFALRQRLSATPARTAVPVYGDHPLEVTTRTKTFQIAAQVVVREGDRRLLDDGVSVASEHKETIAPAFPAGGIDADPDDTPDDAEMASRAGGSFAAAVAGKVRTAVDRAALRLLEDARAKERAGDLDGAVEAYAAYLLVTPEVASPERADAARAILERTGFRTSLRTGLPQEPRR